MLKVSSLHAMYRRTSIDITNKPRCAAASCTGSRYILYWAGKHGVPTRVLARRPLPVGVSYALLMCSRGGPPRGLPGIGCLLWARASWQGSIASQCKYRPDAPLPWPILCSPCAAFLCLSLSCMLKASSLHTMYRHISIDVTNRPRCATASRTRSRYILY